MPKDILDECPVSANHGVEALDFSRTCVNYLRINHFPDDHQKRSTGATFIKAACSIPLDDIDMAFENARRYPDVTFQIWFDFSAFDDSTKFFVDAHKYLNAPANVEYRDLNEIDAYKTHPLLQPKKMDGGWLMYPDIWHRVDLTRLLVLEHCFSSSDAENIFYADFDVPDILLHDKIMNGSMTRNGFTVGIVRETEDHAYYENQFLGFSRCKGRKHLNDFLIPETEAVLNAGDMNGFPALVRFTKKYSTENNLPFGSLGPEMLKPWLTSAEKNPAYAPILECY